MRICLDSCFQFILVWTLWGRIQSFTVSHGCCFIMYLVDNRARTFMSGCCFYWGAWFIFILWIFWAQQVTERMFYTCFPRSQRFQNNVSLFMWLSGHIFSSVSAASTALNSYKDRKKHDRYCTVVSFQNQTLKHYNQKWCSELMLGMLLCSPSMYFL